MAKSCISHLECSYTGKTTDAFQLSNLSEAGKPFLVRYDLEKACKSLTKTSLSGRRLDMWRYHEVMPFPENTPLVTLNEGWTPVRTLTQLGSLLGFQHLYMKDESVNPTGSFKARGISAAITAAVERGAQSFAIPTAGNAGGALAAYAALAGRPSFIFMPIDTPKAFKIECEAAGATVSLVNGLISDCGKIVAQRKDEEGWFDVSTLKEPYRIEGKKTMGYELAEQFDFTLPDVIIYPTGGGTGLIGMWKAFDEMEQMGWIDSKRPRMVSVQTSGCAPIVRAWKKGDRHASYWDNAHTCASGLRVPAAIGDFLILDAIRKSGGCALAVDDAEMMYYSRMLASFSGIFPAPEGGACLAALVKMKEQMLVDAHERIIIFNTGSGYKYLEAFERS